MSDYVEVLSADSRGAPEKNYSYGCFHCMAGKEENILQQLNRVSDGVAGIVPVKLRYRRFAGKAMEESVKLFPGYIFVRVAPNIKTEDFSNMAKRILNTRLLTDMEGNWPLCGLDALTAKTFFDHQGVIGFSKAYYEGDRIRITEGFLKDYEGQITRVNHRARTAEITVVIHDKVFRIWLGFELIDKE